jgi:hypothetical protein
MKNQVPDFISGAKCALVQEIVFKNNKQYLLRSTAMKNLLYNRYLGRGITFLLSLAIVATLATGQDLVIGAGAAFVGNGHYNIAGNITSAAAASISGTVNLDGAAQSISGGAITFNNLNIAGTDVKNSDADIAVQGQLTVNQNLNMNTANNRVLTMKDAAKSTQPSFAGVKEITGSMKWEAYAAQSYTFNNASTVVKFNGADAARTFQLKVQPVTNPSGYQTTTSINRKITAVYAGWSTGTADIQLAYQNGEVDGSLVQTRLKEFHASIASTNKLGGTATITRLASAAGSFGYIKQTNLASTAFASGDELGLDTRFSAYISILAQSWNLPGTWDAGAIPSSSDDVEINTKVTVPDGVAAAANSVAINEGAAKGLTVGGGTSGTLSVGAGGIANSNSSGDGLTVAPGANVTITSGIMNNNGAISNAGTIRVQ